MDSLFNSADSKKNHPLGKNKRIRLVLWYDWFCIGVTLHESHFFVSEDTLKVFSVVHVY